MVIGVEQGLTIKDKYRSKMAWCASIKAIPGVADDTKHDMSALQSLIRYCGSPDQRTMGRGILQGYENAGSSGSCCRDRSISYKKQFAQ